MSDNENKSISSWCKDVHDLAKEKGWWKDGIENRSLGDQFSNFHAELSEAWEEYRKGMALATTYFDENGKPEGIPIELADCIIRIFDTCAAYNIDIEKAIKLKHEYNKKRSYRHGNKLA